MNRDREILFEVRDGDDALVVANGGRPFSRKGVISICASHLSDKRSDDEADDIVDHFRSCEDKDLVRRIRENELRIYDDPNRIMSDSRGEDEASKDYGGRSIWELLQNADDSMGRERSSIELIGSKGLGFKAVLEITERPEVHSSPFHFRFSASRTQALLKRKGLQDPPRLTFRIPHCTKPSERIRKLLDVGYATVIRLPFKDKNAQTLVTRRLDDLDPTFLLFARQLSRVRIRTPNGEIVYEVTGDHTALSDGDVGMSRRGPTGIESVRWRRWRGPQEAKHPAVAICLPLNEQGEPVPCLQRRPLFVFFPTQEMPGVRAVIHATLDLEQNRKRVRDAAHNDEIRDAVAELVGRVIADVPVRTALQVFARVEGDANSVVGRLRQDVRKVLAAAEFVPTVGGHLVRANEVRLWKHRLGFVLREDAPEVINARLLAPEYQDMSNILRSLGARPISTSESIRLLSHCRNGSFAECRRSLVTLKRLLDDAPSESGHEFAIPCWWTDTETARSLDDPKPLLLTRPNDWPDWLVADALHPYMARAVKRLERKPAQRRWRAVSAKLLASPSAYLRCVLVRHVSQWTADQWKEMGWRVLCQARRWWPHQEFDKITPWVPVPHFRFHSDLSRVSVVNRIRIPTDKGWLPAADCYAGEAWDGLPAFDSFIATVSADDRGILLPLDQWPSTIRKGSTEENWKPFFRWLGVSWEPKVRGVKDWLPLDENYCKHVNLVSKGIRWKFNLLIEHFPECMEDPRERSGDAIDPGDAIHAGIRLATALRESPAYYQGYYSGHESFALYQMHRQRWLPCTPALLHPFPRVAPRQAFTPNNGLGGLLPVVQTSGVGKEERQRQLPVLRELGIRDSLPRNPEEWHCWMHRLSEVEREEAKNLPQIADELYRHYLGLGDPGQCLPRTVPIPCFVFVDGREALEFASANEIYYVDQPHLDEVKRDVMKAGYKLFILSLKSGESAPDKLRLARLSGILRPRAVHGQEDKEVSARVCDRYRGRRLGLGLAAGRIELPEELDIQAVEGLRLELSDKNGVVARPDILSWRADTDSPLLICLAKNWWRALGHGLAVRVAEKEGKASLFEVLLGERSNKEYLDRLRSEGITEADLESVKRELEDSTGDGGDIPSPYASDPKERANRAGTNVGEASSGSGSSDRAFRTGPNGSSRRRGRTSGGGRRPDAAVGRDAEDWFEDKLHSSNRQYRIERRERDPQNRESDFVIRDGGAVHIEVKHLARVPGKVHWSSGQCGKACDILDDPTEEYVMALLISDKSDLEEPYQVYWLWNPVKQLVAAGREVQWEGRSRYEPVQSDSWNVADQRPDKVPVRRYMFRIHVDDRLLSDLVEDDSGLGELWRRVEDRHA